MSTSSLSAGNVGYARHRTHHRPVLFTADKFERHEGGMDPAAREEAAHTSARILLTRGRGAARDEQMARRLVSFTDDYGIEMLAELWSHASAHSLPGTLWRMYRLRDTVHRSPHGVSGAFELGMAEDYRSHLVAGVPDPPGVNEVLGTIDDILAGLYTGELDIAMERCAAFARVVALGIRLIMPASLRRLRGRRWLSVMSLSVRRSNVTCACQSRRCNWNRRRTIWRW